MSIKKAILIRVQIVYLLMLIIGIVIIFQILNLQILQNSHWRKRAEDIGLQYRIKKAPRGSIYAENGIMLATSIPLYKVAMDVMVIDSTIYKENILKLSEKLAEFFGDKTKEQYTKLIHEARKIRKRYLIISQKLVSFTDREKLLKFPIFSEGKNKGGLMFEKIEERTYPFGELASRTIGFINDNQDGAGLELSFNKNLSGTNGKALYQKITGGEWKPIGTGARIQPVTGNDIYTTLDVNTQDVAHKALQDALIKHNAKYGCAIITDVKTGAIKAMVNLGKVKEGGYQENYNYAIGDQGSIDPGSTFKTASMLALMEDSTFNLTDTVDVGKGEYKYYDRTMRDTRVGGWGKLTFQQVLEQSSNIGISKLITTHFGKQPEKYLAYLQKFGLNTLLDSSVRLIGMAKPYIKNPKDPTWSGVTLPWMSVGYELRLSPLQMVAFYGAIANNGVMVEPYLVKSIGKNDRILQQFSNKNTNKPFCKKESLEKIKTMLEGVVERGTAKAINTPKYKIAGKTGTSQKLTERGRYVQKYHTSFAGYFPADKPQYACIVVIDEPEGAEQYGGDVSAPVFRQIADRLTKQDLNLDAKPVAKRETSLFPTDLPNRVGWADDFKKVCDELQIPTISTKDAQWVTPVAGRYEIDWTPLNTKANTVPNLKGMTLKDAIFLLEGMNLQVFYTGKGRVKTQSLMPGNSFRKGDRITINLDGAISANTPIIARQLRTDTTQSLTRRDTIKRQNPNTENKEKETKPTIRPNTNNNNTNITTNIKPNTNKNTNPNQNTKPKPKQKGMIIYRKDKKGNTYKEERLPN